jgi:hypothetical protein
VSQSINGTLLSSDLASVIVSLDRDTSSYPVFLKIIKNRSFTSNVPEIVEIDARLGWGFGLKRYGSVVMHALEWILEQKLDHDIKPSENAHLYTVVTFKRKEDAALFKLFWM